MVNSGNANAFTGKSGRAATKLTAAIAAKAAGCKPVEIFLASTGVIGEPLDANKFGPVMDGLATRARGAGVPRRRERNHDDGYVSESRDGDGQDRQGQQ